MSDLSEFLRARIAEDEQHARDCRNWSECGSDDWEGSDETYGCPAHPSTSRRIAECESKRRIVEFYDGPIGTMYVLHFLALAYADHPDYREEWRR